MVLGRADTNLDQDEILPSISNSNSDSDVDRLGVVSSCASSDAEEFLLTNNVVSIIIFGSMFESQSLLFDNMVSSVGSGREWDNTADLNGSSNGRGGARLSTL